MVMKCGQYFCGCCALRRHRKGPSYVTSGAGTRGLFNVTEKLNWLLDKKQGRAKKRRERAIENGEEEENEAEGNNLHEF
jgi:RING finger protein 113A